MKNVYNNMIGHLRSSSDRTGKFSFDSRFIRLMVKKSLLDIV